MELSDLHDFHDFGMEFQGFMILKDELKSIKLVNIVNAIDGDSVFLRCGLGLSNCSEEIRLYITPLLK